MKLKNEYPGILLCLGISIPSWLLGEAVPVIGAPVIGILGGMLLGLLLKNKAVFAPGLRFTSKKMLHYAVILLGFGLNLNVVLRTGSQALPIIILTISAALIAAYLLRPVFRIHSKTATLVAVGSAICGGSAIAATAPVIDADDEEIAQAISVIFFFNVLAALLFPMLGNALGFSAVSGEGFGVFAGTAVNDTSSVTAAAATWDAMHGLGTATLDKAVTVKLTRTLAIIPITLGLAMLRHRKESSERGSFSLRRIFPTFIIFFLLASCITTAASAAGAAPSLFHPAKLLSKFLIVMAMSAIGLNTNLFHLIRSGKRPLLLGFCCWIAVTLASLLMQHVMGIW